MDLRIGVPMTSVLAWHIVDTPWDDRIRDAGDARKDRPRWTAAEWLGVMASLQPAPDLSELVPWLVDGLPANDAADVLAMFPPALAQRYRGEWKPWYDAVSRW